MATNPTPFVTRFEWKFKRLPNNRNDYYDESYDGEKSNEKSVYSPEFGLNNDKLAKFVLFVDEISRNYDNGQLSFGLKMKSNQSKVKNLSVKMCLKRNNNNNYGGRQEIKWYEVPSVTFKSKNDKWLVPKLSQNDQRILQNFYYYDENYGITLCCEITDLNSIRFATQQNPNAEFRKQLFVAYKKDVGTDVTLQVEGKVFKVHQLILTCQSEVFERQLTNPNFKEAQQKLIQINDFKAETIQAFINWLYLGNVEKLSSLSEDLFAVADKYGVTQLKDECAEELADSLNNNNLALRFILAILHSHDPLKNYIIDYISQKPPNEIVRFFMCPTWLNFVKTHDHLAGDMMKMFESRMG